VVLMAPPPPTGRGMGRTIGIGNKRKKNRLDPRMKLRLFPTRYVANVLYSTVQSIGKSCALLEEDTNKYWQDQIYQLSG
jgi:hypothetical protein